MKTATRTTIIKDALWAAGIYGTTVSTQKSGTLRIRRSYFYRPAERLDRFSARIAAAVLALGYTVKRTADDFAQYPKTSYFTIDIDRSSGETR